MVRGKCEAEVVILENWAVVKGYPLRHIFKISFDEDVNSPINEQCQSTSAKYYGGQKETLTHSPITSYQQHAPCY